jgi:16S rRNA (adenine1518-N6/adenine1519-N6)-dimethyltransferase
VPLSRSGASITAVEIDRDLVERMASLALPGVTVVEGDILACWDAVVLAAGPLIRVVGNLPYNISSPVLLHVLESGAAGAIRDATLMLQLEVAERLCAHSHTKAYGTLSVLSSYVADASIVLRLPPGAFRPSPKVHSAVVRLAFPSVGSVGPPGPRPEFRSFADFVRDVFSHRRKTVVNAVRLARALTSATAEAAVAQAGLHAMARPETLSAAEFVALHRSIPHAT